jgi:hypothetical protein
MTVYENKFTSQSFKLLNSLKFQMQLIYMTEGLSVLCHDLRHLHRISTAMAVQHGDPPGKLFLIGHPMSYKLL